MGNKYAADSLGGRAALSKAEAATVTLGELVAESDMMSTPSWRRGSGFGAFAEERPPMALSA